MWRPPPVVYSQYRRGPAHAQEQATTVGLSTLYIQLLESVSNQMVMLTKGVRYCQEIVLPKDGLPPRPGVHSPQGATKPRG